MIMVFGSGRHTGIEYRERNRIPEEGMVLTVPATIRNGNRQFLTRTAKSVPDREGYDEKGDMI